MPWKVQRGLLSSVAALAPAASGGTWVPTDIGADLVGWWDASTSSTVTQSGGTASQVNDRSGNGHHMVQATGSSQPAYSTAVQNGLNVLALDEDFMENSVAANTFGAGGLTFVSVWRKTGAATTFNAPPLTRASGNLPAPLDGWNTNRFIGNGSGAITIGGHRDFGADALFTAWNVLVQEVTSASVYSERINGALDFTVSESLYDDSGAVITLGTRADRATTSRMNFGEGVATKVLSTLNRDKLEGYLAHKWGLAGLLPGGHAYKSAPP